MANWIIRTNAPSVSVEKSRVVLNSSRRVSIGPDDELVLLSTEWTFTHKARVREITESRIAVARGGEKRSWEIHITGWQTFPQVVDLNDVSTSLTFIRNWKRPKVHVRHAYRRLPDGDLETLERGEYFLARHAYLTFISALPRRLVQLFLADSSPDPPRGWGSADYPERSRALIRFIEERVLTIGHVVLDAQSQWDALSSQIGAPKPIPLYVWDEDETAPPINLTSQAETFRTLVPEPGDEREPHRAQLTEIGEVVTSPERQATNHRFELLFRNHADE